MKFQRMPIEVESPEERGYESIKFNLTESSVRDRRLSELIHLLHSNAATDLQDLLVSYVDHRGHLEFRNLLAKEAGVKASDVLLTAGAAAALYLVHASQFDKSTQLGLMTPNYATNIETPRALGVNIEPVELSFENHYELDLDRVESLLSSGCRWLSITYPHNPTGALISEQELHSIVSLVEKYQATLIMDETYREMVLEGPVLPMAAGLSKNAISISSLSKSFGLPGLRIGWLICQNETLMTDFLAAKEQIMICGSAVDEQLGFSFYSHRTQAFSQIRSDLQDHFNILKNWMHEQDLGFSWVPPKGGCVAFIKLPAFLMGREDDFYELLNKTHGTYVGPGHWFEMPKMMFRLGYAYPTTEELRGGLDNLAKAAAALR